MTQAFFWLGTVSARGLTFTPSKGMLQEPDVLMMLFPLFALLLFCFGKVAFLMWKDVRDGKAEARAYADLFKHALERESRQRGGA
jgi:hypothetical protein